METNTESLGYRTLKEAKVAYKKFSSELKRVSEYEDVKKILFEHFKSIPALINTDSEEPLTMFRVTDGNFNTFDETQKKSFSHPPKEKCGKGRVNIQNHPVFYASISKSCAFQEFFRPLEKEPSVGDQVYISEWRIKPGSKYNIAQLLFGKREKLSEHWQSLNSMFQERFDLLMKQNNELHAASSKYLFERASSMFITKSDYRVSSCIGHFLLYELREKFSVFCDIIHYPSIQSGLSNYNLAIHPDFVAKNMELVRVMKAKFQGFKSYGSRYDMFEVGIPVDGENLEWFSLWFDTQDLTVKNVQVEIDECVPKAIDINDEIVVDEEKTSINQIIKEFLHNGREVIQPVFKSIDQDFILEREYLKKFELKIDSSNAFIEREGQKLLIKSIRFDLGYTHKLKAK